MLEEKINIRCPHCDAKLTPVIQTCININLEPDVKPDIISGKLLRHTCPHCNKEYYQHSFTYHDPDKKLLFIMNDIPEERMKLISYRGPEIHPFMIFRWQHYTIRLVRNASELAEKIEIFDNSRDDRVIEVLKREAKNTFKKTKGADLPEDTDIQFIYMHLGKTGERLVNFINGEPKLIYEINETLYKPLKQAILAARYTTDIDPSVIVCPEWADEYVPIKTMKLPQ